MAVTTRFMWQNFVSLGATTLTASSTVSGRAIQWLKRQLRTKTWRSASGWSAKVGFNDVLRFDEGTDQRHAWIHPDDITGDTAADVATALTSLMDAAGLDPADLSSSLWLRADSLALADGADVASWADSSGNARDLDTSVGTQTFVKSAIHGRPAVRFAEDGYLNAAASAVQMDDILDGSGRGSIFAVVWCDSDHTGPSAVWAQADDNRGAFIDASEDLVCRAYDGGQDDATLAGTFSGGWHLLVWQYDGTNVSAFGDDLDDAAADTTASGAQTTLTQDFYLGSDGANHLKGLLAELIVLPGDITEENHRRVAYYLAQKYALTDVTTDTTAPTWANTYVASYSSSDFKFTLARDTGAATLEFPWTEAAWADRSIGLDLGFDVTADDDSATSYEADNAAYQSRAVVDVDFGSTRGVRSVAIINHNFDSGAVLTLSGSDEPWWEGTPDYTGTLDYHADTVVKFFTNQAKRYWRLVVDDVQNEVGYTEIGVLYLGDYFEPTRSYRPGFKVEREELSGVGFSDHGAAFMDDKPTLKGWSILFRPVLDADRIEFETMFDYVKTSRHFFVCLDSAGGDEEGETKYGFLSDTPTVKHLENSTTLYAIQHNFVEAAL